VKRAIVGAVAAAAAAFAVEGGEYGTSDLYRQRVRKRALLVEIDSLQREVDSLAKVKRLLQSDPKLQERIAREEFGMVRGEKELLYRFYDAAAAADSAAAAKSPH
jgi:cell division protein FtsB